MKKIVLLALLSLCSKVYSKSYFVKFNAQESFLSMSKFQSLSNQVFSFRPVSTEIAPFAVVESSLDKEQLKEELESNYFDVVYVESNEIDYKPFDYTPVDNKYSSQWGMHGKYGISSEKAWSVQQGSEDVLLAVIDTGIDYTHPDLKNNLWVNEAELNGQEGVDDDGNGFSDDIYGINSFANNGNPLDGHGHGTHCAGVIGAVHNEIGVAGVMANVKIMGVKIFSDSGKTSVEAIVRGIEYAVKNGAKIMSNSWGGRQQSQGIADAIKAAGEAGVLFVAAAGNGNIWGMGINIDKKPVYPAGYDFDHVLSVGSITNKGKRSRFSNYGKKGVDLFAPGSSIVSTFKKQGYQFLSGTSMATPHASGVAGLVLSEFPGADALEIKSRIMEGTRKLKAFSKNSVSGGILDAAGALGL